MKESRPYKDKPWIVLKETNFWDWLLGSRLRWKLSIDTKHPEWINQVLKPTIEEFKKAKIIK